jgi:hypothetical protein
MSLYDSADGCESYTVSGELGGGMETLKWLKETIRRPRIEPTTVVFDEVDDSVLLRLTPKLNASPVMV